jgi:hypothetical protein
MDILGWRPAGKTARSAAGLVIMWLLRLVTLLLPGRLDLLWRGMTCSGWTVCWASAKSAPREVAGNQTGSRRSLRDFPGGLDTTDPGASNPVNLDEDAGFLLYLG